MLNVIEFRRKAPRVGASMQQHAPQEVDAEISDLASRITRLQSKAMGEIDDAVQMMDLAAQHARLIAEQLVDPSVRSDFDDHIATIDRLIQISREMALKL